MKVCNYSIYYILSYRNATNKLGLSCMQKVTTTFWMLCNGAVAYSTYEYVCIGESITIESMRRLVIAVVEIFEDEYLRSPNQNDITRLLAIAEEIGFLGMLDSIDCMQ
jgi:hypothetical protein